MKSLFFSLLFFLFSIESILSQNITGSGIADVSNSGFTNSVTVQDGNGHHSGVILFKNTYSTSFPSNVMWIGGPSYSGDFYMSVQPSGASSTTAPNYIWSWKGDGTSISCNTDLKITNLSNIVASSTPLLSAEPDGTIRKTNILLNSSASSYTDYGYGGTSYYGTTTLGVAMAVGGRLSATEYLATSDLRYKQNVKAITDPINKIKSLRGVTYNWKSKEFPAKNFDDLPQVGFIAQEVAKIIPEAVMIDHDGYLMMKYNALIPVLTEAIKDQQKTIDIQKNDIIELKKDVEILKNLVNSSFNTLDLNGAKLMQPIPNPSSNQTEINYFLPDNQNNASITIYDLQGKILKRVQLTDKGLGKISVNVSNLANGMYIYDLNINGKIIDSKKMSVSNN